MTECLKRRARIAIRIVAVIDALAPLRLGATARDVAKLLNDSIGESWSVRSVRRDLDALVEAGFVDRIVAKVEGVNSPVVVAHRYRLRLHRSEAFQKLAL